MAIKAVVFDAYGTLFDVYSIGVLAERLFPGKGTALATFWRDRQIEYTRLRTLSDRYKPFWDVTQDALVFSCRALGLALDAEKQAALMAQYAVLTPFSENLAVLQALRQMALPLAILSNGNPPMLESVVEAAGMRSLFAHLLSADEVRKFKTASQAYQLGPDRLGLPAADILFVSSNCWDVCGAAWFGYQTFWVNRADAPAEELDVMPQAQGRLLTDVLQHVRQQNPA